MNENQKESVRKSWLIFKDNPRDVRLRPHKIHYLSGKLNKIVRAVKIEDDLRVVFYIEGNLVITFNVGPHKIYKQSTGLILIFI